MMVLVAERIASSANADSCCGGDHASAILRESHTKRCIVKLHPRGSGLSSRTRFHLCHAVEFLEARRMLSDYTFRTLATFNGTNGSGPAGIVMDAGGNLYGTTASGGST